MSPTFVVEEPRRLSALRRYAILNSIAELAYDDLTSLAAYIAKTPIALISFVDRDRQWFKSRHGLGVSETPRNQSFCAHAILEPENIFTVPDALADPRFCDNALVTGDPNIRFYCGAKLMTPDNQSLGTLCVIDRVPRRLDEGQVHALELLSHQVMMLLEMRKFTLDQYEVTRDPSKPVGASPLFAS